MLATLTDAPFDDPGWVFEDKYDGFRMIAEIRRGKVALYSRNGKIISHSYIEVAKALEAANANSPTPQRDGVPAPLRTALELAEARIRVNSVHPTNCNTDMIHNPAVRSLFRPDLENPTAEECLLAYASVNAWPNSWVEPLDIFEARKAACALGRGAS